MQAWLCFEPGALRPRRAMRGQRNAELEARSRSTGGRTPTMLSGAEAADMMRRALVRPNVRVKLPAEAGFVSPVRDDSTTGADRAYKACRSGSA
jgi:hypothetical protein